MKSVLSDFVSLFFPSTCLGCGGALARGEEVLCTFCLSDLPKTNYHLFPDNPVANKLQCRIPISFGSSYLKFRKGGIVQKLLHELKYNNHPEVGVRLGQAFGKDLERIFVEGPFDTIVPIPLHTSRQRQRGYNQSAAFATGLGQALALPVEEKLIVRRDATATQTRKSRMDRWLNVESGFVVSRKEEVRDRHMLLVDDVITTGATLEACGLQLLNAGCKSLGIVCIADAL